MRVASSMRMERRVKKKGDCMVTLSDVAKRANVSKMTVSRVINHPEQVTEELQNLVHNAMAELNYKPNRLAKALANQQTQMIKLYILEEMDVVEPYYMKLLTGIAKELDKHSYGLQLLTRVSRNFGQSDGYIICGMREDDFTEIDALEDPVVLFGANDHGYDCVDLDNTKSIETVCHYCLERGYEQLVFIQMAVDEPFARQREVGYKTVMAANDLTPHIIPLVNDSDISRQYINEHIDEFVPKTAFICATDRLAIGVLRALTDQDKCIPDDYGITGHDGIFLDQIAHPKLTTIKQPIIEMGEACARMLVQKIKRKEDPAKDMPEMLYFSPNLIVGGTTK